MDYKYKVDNYDEIMNDATKKKGTIHVLRYDFKKNEHEFFTAKYVLNRNVENIGDCIVVIASNYCMKTQNGEEPNRPVVHENMMFSDFIEKVFDDGNIIIFQGQDYLIAAYPDEHDELVNRYNAYLDRAIHSFTAAKL
jgi:hypothetical protein